MLRPVAPGVWVHESSFIRSNAVVVQGRAGVLLIDPGIESEEMACLAGDLREAGQSVVAGFSTHPHWDHVLWHPDLGTPPRFGTAVGAAMVQARLADPNFAASVAGMIPEDIVERVPVDDLFGRVTGLPAETALVPWDGPAVRIIEHQAHAPGHAALLIEKSRVLVAGDMLSDVLIPMLNAMAPDPIGDYLAALQLFDKVADGVEVVIPGHGSVGAGDEVRVRIAQDRAYVEALRDSASPADPRIGPSAKPGWEWVSDVHEGQLQRLAHSSRPDETP